MDTDANCPGNSGKCKDTCENNGNLSTNKKTIEDAIDAASAGDTISVCDGTYIINAIEKN